MGAGDDPYAITVHERVDDFIAATEGFRMTEPVLTNVIGSIAEGARAGRAYDRAMWLDVRDSGGQVVGCAVRTPPWNLVVSPMPVAAAAAVGRHVAAADPVVPGITGVRAVADAVIDVLATHRGSRLLMVDVVRLLDGFTPSPTPAAGTSRRADDTDRALLVAWLVQFGIDASLPLHDVEDAVDQRLAARALWFWEVDGEPVAMAGHAAPVSTPAGTVARIGPVYTPAHKRGKGYGTAVTSAVVEVLLPQSTMIILYADAANRTSNAVYERLGFRAVAEVVEIELSPP